MDSGSWIRAEVGVPYMTIPTPKWPCQTNPTNSDSSYTSTPSDVSTIHCVCSNNEDSWPQLQCESCLCKSHTKCVGISPLLAKLYPFVCPFCVRDKVVRFDSITLQISKFSSCLSDVTEHLNRIESSSLLTNTNLNPVRNDVAMLKQSIQSISALLSKLVRPSLSSTRPVSAPLDYASTDHHFQHPNSSSERHHNPGQNVSANPPPLSIFPNFQPTLTPTPFKLPAPSTIPVTVPCPALPMHPNSLKLFNSSKSMDSESEQQELCVGDIVWCPIYGYPKWPCKIEEVSDEFVEALSFGDNASVSVKLGRVQKFSNNDQTKLFIKNGRQSCKNRPDTLKMFNSSIAEALTVIRESNPDFTFEYESLDDFTLLPNTPASPVVTSTPASRSRYSRAVKPVTPLVAEPISNLKRHPSKRLNDRSSVDLPLDQLIDNSYGTSKSFFNKRKRKSNFFVSKNKRFAANHECLNNLVKDSIAAHDTIDTLHSSSDSVMEALSKKFQYSQNESSQSEDTSAPLTTSHDPVNVSITTDTSPNIPPNTSCVTISPKSISSTTSNKGTAVSSDDSGSGCGLGRSLSLSKESDDDDLTECDFGDSVSDIRPNDIVWAKWRRYPYWPAIVDRVQVEKKSKSSSVQKRRKSTPAKSSENNFKVFFLAYEDDHSLKVSGEKNILKYNYKNNERLKKEGKAYLLKEFESKLFELAIKEAEDLIRLRIQGEVTGPPKAQMDALKSRRPKTYDDIKIVPSIVEDEECLKTAEESSKPAASAFGYNIGDTPKELIGDEEEISSDGNESSKLRASAFGYDYYRDTL